MSDIRFDCQACRDMLDDYRRSGLTGADRQRVRQHLESCTECDALLRADEQLGTMLRSTSAANSSTGIDLQKLSRAARHELQHAQSVPSHAPFRLLAMAAALTLVAGTGALVYLKGMSERTSQIQNRSIATVAKRAAFSEPPTGAAAQKETEAVLSPTIADKKLAKKQDALTRTSASPDATASDRVEPTVRTESDSAQLPPSAPAAPAPVVAAPEERTQLAAAAAVEPDTGSKDALPAQPGNAETAFRDLAAAPAPPQAAVAQDEVADNQLKKQEIAERRSDAAVAGAAASRSMSADDSAQAVQSSIAQAGDQAVKLKASTETNQPETRLLFDLSRPAAPQTPASTTLAYGGERKNGPLASVDTAKDSRRMRMVAAADGVIAKPPSRTTFSLPAQYSVAGNDRQLMKPATPGAAGHVQVTPTVSLAEADRERLAGDTKSAMQKYRQLARLAPSAQTADAQLRLAELMYEDPAQRAGSVHEYRGCLNPALIRYYSEETVQDIRAKLSSLETPHATAPE